MSKRLRACLLIGIFSLSIFSGCSKSNGSLSKISVGDVESVVVSKGETVQAIYDKGTNDKEIQEVVDIYNDTEPTTSEVSLNEEDIRVKIELKDKENIYLKDGDNNAETVTYKGKNFNVTSDKLAGYFDDLSSRFSK